MSLINYLLGESAKGEYIPIGSISPILLLLWVIHPHNSHYQDMYIYIYTYPHISPIIPSYIRRILWLVPIGSIVPYFAIYPHYLRIFIG